MMDLSTFLRGLNQGRIDTPRPMGQTAPVNRGGQTAPDPSQRMPNPGQFGMLRRPFNRWLYRQPGGLSQRISGWLQQRSDSRNGYGWM